MDGFCHGIHLTVVRAKQMPDCRDVEGGPAAPWQGPIRRTPEPNILVWQVSTGSNGQVWTGTGGRI